MSDPATPFFSVIIPVYNREALIRETLDSVFAQTYDDYEVIVVDDGSTDDTVSVLEKYADRITILQQENQGPGVARNAGVRVAPSKSCARYRQVNGPNSSLVLMSSRKPAFSTIVGAM